MSVLWLVAGFIAGLFIPSPIDNFIKSAIASGWFWVRTKFPVVSSQ